jgi:hypothetical protein
MDVRAPTTIGVADVDAVATEMNVPFNVRAICLILPMLLVACSDSPAPQPNILGLPV